MRRLAWAALAFCVLAQVYALYLYPGGTGPPPFPQADKVVHVLLFALPAALAAWLGRLWPLVLLALHAVLSEPLQGWLTRERHPEGWDAVADAVGIVLGVWVVWSLRRRAAAGSVPEPGRPDER